MTYTAKTAVELRQGSGSLLKKISSELTLIDAAIDALGSGTGALTTGQIFVGAAGVAADVAMSGDITIATGGATTIGAGKVTLANHVAASEDGTVVKVVAESAVIGGIPVVHMVPVSGTGKAAVNVTLTHKTRVLDAHVILRGSGVTGGTITVCNGATAITDVMVVSGSDQAIVRAAAIDDAAYEIAAAGSLRVTPGATGTDATPCLVVVTGVRVT
jgi:hypothetical protein